MNYNSVIVTISLKIVVHCKNEHSMQPFLCIRLTSISPIILSCSFNVPKRERSSVSNRKQIGGISRCYCGGTNFFLTPKFCIIAKSKPVWFRYSLSKRFWRIVELKLLCLRPVSFATLDLEVTSKNVMSTAFTFWLSLASEILPCRTPLISSTLGF